MNIFQKISVSLGVVVLAVTLMGLQCPSGRPDIEPDIASFDSVEYEPGLLTINWTYQSNGTTQDYRFWPFIVIQKEIDGAWSNDVNASITPLTGLVAGVDIDWDGMGFRGDEPPQVSCVVESGQFAIAPVYDNCNCSPWGNDHHNKLAGCVQGAQILEMPMFLENGKYRVKLGVGFDDINDDNVAENRDGCTGHDDDKDNAASVSANWITFGVGIIEGESYSCDITVQNEVQPFTTNGKCLYDNGNPVAVELWWDESQRADFYTLRRVGNPVPISPEHMTERRFIDTNAGDITDVNDYVVEAYREVSEDNYIRIEDSKTRVSCPLIEPQPAGVLTINDPCPDCGDAQIDFEIVAELTQCPIEPVQDPFPVPHCGDGAVNVAGEECDDGANGNNNDQCFDNCTLTSCGDGYAQNPNGEGVAEECDDGNTVSGDGCDAGCQNEVQVLARTSCAYTSRDSIYNDRNRCSNNEYMSGRWRSGFDDRNYCCETDPYVSQSNYTWIYSSCSSGRFGGGSCTLQCPATHPVAQEVDFSGALYFRCAALSDSSVTVGSCQEYKMDDYNDYDFQCPDNLPWITQIRREGGITSTSFGTKTTYFTCCSLEKK